MRTETGRSALLATASLGVLWATAGIGNALAASPYESPRPLTLNLKDLDLSKPGGVAVLYDRIVAASVNVCRPWNADSAGVKVKWDSCRDATVSHTIEIINLPALTRYYVAKVCQGRTVADLQAKAD